MPVYLPNGVNKPMYVVNTTADQLYPSRIVTPFIDGMKKEGARITYKVHENIGHRPEYWPTEQPLTLDFIRVTARKPFPDSMTWETSRPEFGRCHWIKIEEIADIGLNAKELTNDINPVLTVSRVRIGIYIDQNYFGQGVRVDKLAEGQTPAGRIGVQAGDVITAMDGKQVASFEDLRKILQGKKPGDEFSLKITRGEKEITVKGEFDPIKRQPAFTRTVKAGRISARREGNRVDVLVRNVAKYTLYFSRDHIDAEKPVEIRTNGALSFKGMVESDPAVMLELAAEDDDRTMVFWGKVEVDLRKAPAGDDGAGDGDDGDSEF
jgi:hypothetical protein